MIEEWKHPEFLRGKTLLLGAKHKFTKSYPGSTKAHGIRKKAQAIRKHVQLASKCYSGISSSPMTNEAEERLTEIVEYFCREVSYREHLWAIYYGLKAHGRVLPAFFEGGSKAEDTKRPMITPWKRTLLETITSRLLSGDLKATTGQSSKYNRKKKVPTVTIDRNKWYTQPDRRNQALLQDLERAQLPALHSAFTEKIIEAEQKISKEEQKEVRITKK